MSVFKAPSSFCSPLECLVEIWFCKPVYATNRGSKMTNKSFVVVDRAQATEIWKTSTNSALKYIHLCLFPGCQDSLKETSLSNIVQSECRTSKCRWRIEKHGRKYMKQIEQCVSNRHLMLLLTKQGHMLKLDKGLQFCWKFIGFVSCLIISMPRYHHYSWKAQKPQCQSGPAIIKYSFKNVWIHSCTKDVA